MTHLPDLPAQVIMAVLMAKKDPVMAARNLIDFTPEGDLYRSIGAALSALAEQHPVDELRIAYLDAFAREGGDGE